jgi:hypothetical protein
MQHYRFRVGDVAKASHANRSNNTKSLRSRAHVQFVSSNLAADSIDRGGYPYDGMDIIFGISNRQTRWSRAVNLCHAGGPN